MQLLLLPGLQKQRPTPEVRWLIAYNWGLVKEGTVGHLQVQCFYKPGKEVLCQQDTDLQTKIKSILKYPAIRYFIETISYLSLIKTNP